MVQLFPAALLSCECVRHGASHPAMTERRPHGETVQHLYCVSQTTNKARNRLCHVRGRLNQTGGYTPQRSAAVPEDHAV